MENRYGTKWTYDETVIALGLYFQIPFAKVNKNTPEVVRVAKLMGRAPASLSMKIGNLGRLDPTLLSRGISGLVNGAKMEVDVWNEYCDRIDELSIRYYELLQSLDKERTKEINEDNSINTLPGLDGVSLSHYRINQSFFRHSVLSAYNNTCCITGLSEMKLLVASHIKPWAKCENGNERTKTENGLCLNALHDKAFDNGLLTLDENLRVVLSGALKSAVQCEVFKDYFVRYEGKQISLPERGSPSEEFLSYHRENIFVF